MLIVPLLDIMACLMVVYFAEYTINSGVVSVLSFSAEAVAKKTFYVRAGFTYQVGVFFSRSSGTLFPIRTLWPFPVLQLVNLGLLLAQATTQAVDSSWLVLLFVFWEGLLGGAVYVNGFATIRERAKPEYREFSLGVASVADTSGIVAASLLSTWLEPALNAFRTSNRLPVA